MPEPALAPIPFEDPGGIPAFWPRVGRTLRLACTRPLEFFPALAAGRSLLAPWRFKLLCAAPIYVFLTLVWALVGLVTAVAGRTGHHPTPWPFWIGWGALLAALLVLGPLLQLVTLLVGGGLQHALLWAWGGIRTGRGLRQTVRAVGYTQAMAGLVALVPGVGILGYLGCKVALGVGLARLHGQSPWRGVAAALTQALLLALALTALLVALVVAGVRRDESQRQILAPAPEEAPAPPAPPRPSRPIISLN